MDVRVAEEVEVGREEAGRVPPCVDELGGEVSREVRRAKNGGGQRGWRELKRG